MAQCEFHKQDNSACGAKAMRGAKFCFSHNPAAATKKRAAVTKGGTNRRTARKVSQPPAATTINSVADVQALMFKTLADFRNGLIDDTAAKTIGYLGGVAVKVAETVGLAQRLEELMEHVVEVDKRLKDYDATAARA